MSYVLNKPTPEDKPKNRVWALPDREEMEIRFPIVEGYVFQPTRGLLKCDLAKIEPLTIDPRLEPTTTFLRPTAGYLDTQSGIVPFEFVQQDRASYYAQTHFQGILFQIAQKIIEDLLAPTMFSTDKKSRVFRLQSRHLLFPQVFAFVRAFVRSKVNFKGVDQRELGLEKYTILTVERLRDAIMPDDSSGEPPLLPILDRYRPVGTTGGVDFPTTRPISVTTKSHINSVVQHSSWEAEAAKVLEASDLVKCYARNDHVGLYIKYEYLGIDHDYEPDFLVRLVNDLNLLLEIKGYEVHNPEQLSAKHNAANKWATAVNNQCEFGRWDFLVCRDLGLLQEKLAGFVKEPGPGLFSKG
jgi:type III restriction enzyme